VGTARPGDSLDDLIPGLGDRDVSLEARWTGALAEQEVVPVRARACYRGCGWVRRKPPGTALPAPDSPQLRSYTVSATRTTARNTCLLTTGDLEQATQNAGSATE
jgi:hypothetical protein